MHQHLVTIAAETFFHLFFFRNYPVRTSRYILRSSRYISLRETLEAIGAKHSKPTDLEGLLPVRLECFVQHFCAQRNVSRDTDANRSNNEFRKRSIYFSIQLFFHVFLPTFCAPLTAAFFAFLSCGAFFL